MKKYLIIYCLCVSTVFFATAGSKLTEIEGLRCEYLVNPLGLDCIAPRFTWILPFKKSNLYQSAYQIMVDTDSVALISGKATIWNSGKVLSDSILVAYKGSGFKPFTKYYWKVIYWNQKGQISKPSRVASFETGLLKHTDWQGRWISDGKSIDFKPAPYFRKEFILNKKIKMARVYTVAAGLFDLTINGKNVSNEMLNPMYTCFDRRNLYVTNDITSLIVQGKNVIGVLLGNGWYNLQSTTVWDFDKAVWRNRPRFLLNLKIEYLDGTEKSIVTDESWKTIDSPVIFNSIYTAEHYDARKELQGWNKPDFDDRLWRQSVIEAEPSNKIVAQQLHPVKVTDTLRVLKMIKRNDTDYIFHFERNIAGNVKLKVHGEEGTVLKIRCAELLDKNGNPDMSNIDYHYRPVDDSDPFQTDIFILSGRSEDNFTPKFNYKGFQYVQVISSKPVDLVEESIVALEIHSDVPQVGYINSSNQTLNKIWQATNSSYLANLFGYPTDCPQREKNGWTGDAHIAIETGLYNFDGITVYEKWLNDFSDVQKENGILPCIIPTTGWGYDWANGVDWTSAVAIVPWEIYKFYGDSRLLNRMYDNIKRYVGYITSISPEGLTDWGLGDWIPVKSISNKEFTTSVYYYVNLDILSKASVLLGKTNDAFYYSNLTKKVRDVINTKFLNKESGIYCSGTQTELSAALYWGIVPNDLKAKVAENLYKKIVDNDFHLDVGLLGTKTILNALSENGYAEAAYKIAVQETYPSWGYWIKNGATTLHENWKIDAIKDASLNHIMFGEVGAWLYKGLGGIFPDENNPGFKHVILKPNFVGGLEEFEAKYKSPQGWIFSKWKVSGNKVKYNIIIPSNSTATLYLPDNIGQNKSICLKSGSYSFSFTKK